MYLAEPWIRSLDFVHTMRDPNPWLYACDDAEQIVGRRDDDVPSYLFGQHPFLREYAERRKVPLLGAFGDTTNEPNGDSYLIVTTTIEDPQYLAQPYLYSTHFTRANASGAGPVAMPRRIG